MTVTATRSAAVSTLSATSKLTLTVAGRTTINITAAAINIGTLGNGPTQFTGGKLYKSMDAAAIAWTRVMAGNTAKNQNEYSSNIFSIPGKNDEVYYGYTPPASFVGVKNREPIRESPGPGDKLSTKDLPWNATVVGNIHSHTGKAGWRNNNDFSPTTFAQKGDEGVHKQYPSLKFYLITPNGNLINTDQGPNYPTMTELPQSADPEANTGPAEIMWDQLNIRTLQELEPVGTWYKNPGNFARRKK